MHLWQFRPVLHNISHQLHNWIRQYSNMPGSKKEKTLFILHQRKRTAIRLLE